MEFILDIGRWFGSINWRELFFTLRWIFIVLDVILIVFFVIIFIKALEFRPKFVFNPKPGKRSPLKDPKLLERWAKIIKKAGSGPPQSLTLAVIEADSFVDDVLKKMNLPGEGMAERMERLGNRNLKTIERLWRAHKKRNELVHTPGFSLSPQEAKKILGDYEAFLKEIELLK